jgi:hypothetical protein
MFGSGLPVCAAFYPAVHELVGHEYNGLLFSSPSELVAHLLRLFQLAPQNYFPFVTEAGSDGVGDSDSDYVHISTSKPPTTLGIKRISEEKLNAKLEADSKSTSNSPYAAEAKETPSQGRSERMESKKTPPSMNVTTQISSTPNTPIKSAVKILPLADIQRLKQGVLAIDTWDENWAISMKPYILEVLQRKSAPLVWSPIFTIIFFLFNLFSVYVITQMLKW